jgi:3-oxoadipate enol-lactonase
LATAIIDRYHLEYEVEGPADAPALVLSDSLGTNFHMWDGQASALAEGRGSRRLRIVRYDTRGHGRTSVTPGPYTVRQLAHDVVELLDYLEIPRAHFCGLSLGGLTGLYLAREHPDRLLKIVVSSASARLGNTEMWDTRIAAVRQGGMAALAPSILTRWFTEDFRARDPLAVQRIEQQVLSTPAEGYAGCCGALRDADLRPLVADIRTPTLVVAGSFDPAVPIDDVRWLADHLPGARFAELPTAHLSNVEAPQAFNETISSFLAE